jgi:hypothetical protein
MKKPPVGFEPTRTSSVMLSEHNTLSLSIARLRNFSTVKYCCCTSAAPKIIENFPVKWEAVVYDFLMGYIFTGDIILRTESWAWRRGLITLGAFQATPMHGVAQAAEMAAVGNGPRYPSQPLLCSELAPPPSYESAVASPSQGFATGLAPSAPFE